MNTRNKILKGLLFISLSLTLLSFELPKGWFKAGSKPKSYDMGMDPGAGQDGSNAATIQSIDKKIDGFGTMMQNCLPMNYLGHRIRLSGLLKTKDVSEWSGLWLRIDQKGTERTLGFDNMKDGKEDRSVKGTTEWKNYSIVLDVPLNASNIAYGALLVGTGQIWFDHLKFEIVDSSVDVTGQEKEKLMPINEPVNLDFEK